MSLHKVKEELSDVGGDVVIVRRVEPDVLFAIFATWLLAVHLYWNWWSYPDL